jgi:hypothetical protein
LHYDLVLACHQLFDRFRRSCHTRLSRARFGGNADFHVSSMGFKCFWLDQKLFMLVAKTTRLGGTALPSVCDGPCNPLSTHPAQ